MSVQKKNGVCFMKKKSAIIVAILMMSIGFAAISLVLVDFSNNFYTGIGMVTSDGHISDSYANSDYGVRPVVSLVNSTLINSNGDGTSANPYVVE